MNSPRWMPPWCAAWPPLLAFGLQWLCWSWLQPLVWFLFFPAVFLSSWRGNLLGGLWATLFSILIVWYFFIPPEGSFVINDPRVILSIVLFSGMGGLIAVVHGRLSHSRQHLKDSLAANERLECEGQARMQELAAIVESSADAIAGKDLNGVVTSWNAGAERMFGYSASEMVGRSITQIIPLERRDEEDLILSQIKRGERVEHFETMRLTKSGAQIVVSVTVSPIKNAQGQVIGASKIARNITDRQRTQNELRIKQEHSLSLLHLARKLEQADSVSSIIHAAAEELEKTLGFHCAWFYHFSDDRRSMRLMMVSPTGDAGLSEDETDEMLIEGDPMLEEIATADKIVVVDDARVDPRTNKQIVAKLGSRTIVNMPVFMSGRKLGVIGSGTFGDEGVRILSPAEREFFSALGSHLAAVLDRIQETEKRQRAEEALRETDMLLHAADRRLAQMVHGMTEACFVLDADWKFVFVNDRSETLLRHQREQMLGRSIWDVFYKLLGTPMEANYRQVMTERVSLSFEAYSPIAERWLDIRLFPTGDGLAAFLLDVHERKLAENEVRQLNTDLEQRVHKRTAELAAANTQLAQNRAELQSLFESLPGLYLVLTPEFKIVAASDAYLQATMTNREDIIGRGLFEVFPDNPDEPDATGETNLRASLTSVRENCMPHTMAIQKYDIRRPDGVFEERYWSPINSPVVGADRKIQYLIHRVEEVTEFVRSKSQAASGEASLNSRMVQMEAEIFQSSQRVQAANRQLEAANKELESFSYSVSHDLRAPLRAMDGFSRAVLEDYGPQLPADGLRYLQIIRTSTQRMGNLIDDLLSFSRLSRAPMSKRTIATTRFVKDVLDELLNHQEARQIDVSIGELPACEGDPALLKQVWINLLSNALKYTQKRKETVIEIGCTTEGRTNTYFVRDNGTGFDMRYAHKLFGVFQRLHRAEDYDGTGVGLAIVQRIIHRHGGKVWADAVVGQGATFYFTLEAENQS